jgi:hypothetical protein
MELELIRTILGEEVPTNILLSCLHASAFDVSTAVNLYFSQITLTDNLTIDISKSIRSSMPLTIHPFDAVGMVGSLNGVATLTTGSGAYDTISPLNERFRVLRLRKRGAPGTSSFSFSTFYFENGKYLLRAFSETHNEQS